VHAALFSRDNVSDVWDGLDSLAEQASYIWFTREIDAQMQPGTVELPPKDPTRVSSTLRHGDPKDPTRGFAASSKRSSLKRASAKNGGNGGSKGGGKSGGSFGSSPGSKFGNGIGSSSALPPPTPSLRVVPAAQMGAYSKENGLLALNLLLFEVLRFSPRERGDNTAEHASLVHLVRRQGGPASLFSLCALYAALARRLGIPLQLVTLELPEMVRGRGPDFLLRMPAQGEEAELFVDVLAEGRLRGPWDLAAYTNEDLGLEKAGKDALTAQMRAFVHEVTPTAFCLRLVEEFATACEAADNLAEASFWQIQLDVLDKQIVEAQERRAAEHGERDIT